jgi:lysozyme family protein
MIVILNDPLKKQYRDLYNSCIINPSKTVIVNGLTNRMLTNKTRYESVAAQLNIPWRFIGVIHNMESSMNFSRHLHNGDPLSSRTVHVPAGRPSEGSPPFTWEESAADALILRKIDQWKDWTLEGMIYQLENYNGWGYRLHHPEVLSPYLWSFSNHYTKGKYIADGTWSDTAISNQCGAAVLLKKSGFPGIIIPNQRKATI